jgi:predicted peroxiredoxin
LWSLVTKITAAGPRNQANKLCGFLNRRFLACYIAESIEQGAESFICEVSKKNHAATSRRDVGKFKLATI